MYGQVYWSWTGPRSLTDWSTEPYGLVNGALRTSLKVVMHGVTSLKVVMHGVSLKMHERVGHGAKDVHFWFYRAL